MLRFFLNSIKVYCILLLIIVAFFIILLFSFDYFLFVFKCVDDFLFFFDKHSSGIIAISTFLGLIFGRSWLNTSKKKMKGKLDYDIARKYLKSVLKVRDAVKLARHPFISIGEIEFALKKTGFKGDEYDKKKKVDRSVYSLRWDNVQKSWTSFEEILTEAEISWGKEAINIQKKLDVLVRELRGVIWLFVNYPDSFSEKPENSNILYGTQDESDVFSSRINIEIEEIRNFLKKHL